MLKLIVLYREMQFGGIAHSCLFVNERGDLLVALSDQVALVRFQDYLPPSVLQEMLTVDFWTDDVEETAKAFDSDVDVWGLNPAKPIVSEDIEPKVTGSRYDFSRSCQLCAEMF